MMLLLLSLLALSALILAAKAAGPDVRVLLLDLLDRELPDVTGGKRDELAEKILKVVRK